MKGQNGTDLAERLKRPPRGVNRGRIIWAGDPDEWKLGVPPPPFPPNRIIREGDRPPRRSEDERQRDLRPWPSPLELGLLLALGALLGLLMAIVFRHPEVLWL